MTFLPVAFQVQAVADRSGKFILIMGYHNHCFIPAGAESLYDLLYSAAIVGIQSMQRFVKNQQFGIFHESACQQRKTLFAAGELQERFILQSGYAKNKPLTTQTPQPTPGLTTEERKLYETLCTGTDIQYLRIEQERIPIRDATTILHDQHHWPIDIPGNDIPNNNTK